MNNTTERALRLGAFRFELGINDTELAMMISTGLITKVGCKYFSEIEDKKLDTSKYIGSTRTKTIRRPYVYRKCEKGDMYRLTK